MSQSYGKRTVQVRQCRLAVSLLLTFERWFVFFINDQRVPGGLKNGEFFYLTAAAEVSDVGTGAPPSDALFSGGPLGVEERSHPLRIQAAALHQVGDGEAVGGSSLHVPDPEVEPLRVLPGVHVSTQGQLILVYAPEREGEERAKRAKNRADGRN